MIIGCSILSKKLFKLSGLYGNVLGMHRTSVLAIPINYTNTAFYIALLIPFSCSALSSL